MVIDRSRMMRALDVWQQERSSGVSGAMALLLVAALLLSVAIVYAAGGTHNASLHIIYIPILLSAFWYGLPGGILMAVVAGVALGPMMPLHVASGEMQPALNWLVRTAFFVIFGAVAGVSLGLLREYSVRLREYAFVSRDNNLPTSQRLAFDVQDRAREREPLVLLMVVQASNFDTIAHTVGFDSARRLPAAMLRRIAPVLSTRMICYELSSDRVAIAVYGESQGLDRLAPRLVDQLKRPVGLGHFSIYVEVRVGVYRAADAEDLEPTEMLRRASSALIAGRDSSQEISVYAPEMDVAARENQLMMDNLFSALEEGRVFLEYQPRIELATGRVVGAEALVRMRGRDGDIIPPGRFVPLAEGSNVIHALTERVMEDSVRQAARWRSWGHELRLSINFSTRNLGDDYALDHLHRLCHAFEVPVESIELEVTESAMVQDAVAFHRVIGKARELGFHVAIDDFGTGYTTLGSLSVLPINTIKLDRSMIVRMQSQTSGETVVSSVVDLCRRLGFLVVAEGIEDAETLEKLRAMGCQEGQGFLMARPMSAPALERALRESGARGALQDPATGHP